MIRKRTHRNRETQEAAAPRARDTAKDPKGATPPAKATDTLTNYFKDPVTTTPDPDPGYEPYPLYMYGKPEQTQFTAFTKDQAILDILDDIILQHSPNTIQVTTYRRPTMDPSNFNPLEFLLENLDDNYADPEDTGATPPTPAMQKAEHQFIQAVLNEYKSWHMDPILTETVHIADWLQQHPDKFPEARQRTQYQ